MNILLVCATEQELKPFLEQYKGTEQNTGLRCLSVAAHSIDVLITGVGMVATAYHVAKHLPGKYDLALNAGICGSFSYNLDLGSVVHVYEDQFAELGAEDGELFLSLEDLGLEGITKILNPAAAFPAIDVLPKVNGITVNTTHGNEASIDAVVQRLHPIVESMEGAAFMFACRENKVPYAQIRAVSNYVEKRNREKWNIPLAIKNLNDKLSEIINVLPH